MKIGIVCPYSFDAPGGVQFHIRDLAAELIGRGHKVSVIAPAEDTESLPDFVVSAGGSIPINYNGSVARLAFGPKASNRVGRWLAGHDFDLIHIHEPMPPSLGLLALWQADVPIVATFHSSQERSRAMSLVAPAMQSLLEKIDARIAVSEEARRTIADHVGGSAVVIPNGVYLDAFRKADPDPRWAGCRHGGSPTVAFLGRIDEPRKGLPVFAAAIGPALKERPEMRFFIAGRGEATEIRHSLAQYGDRVTFLGEITDADKASLLGSVDVYCAPQTGAESFGIVLVEAMAGGAAVVASDIPAFRDVTGNGTAGLHFQTGSGDDLARKLLSVFDGGASVPSPETVQAWAERYDWANVATQILDVYRLVLSSERTNVAAVGRSEPEKRRWSIWPTSGKQS
ncbi:MAG TPA: glycosyltransferase family 4 protein [Actinomycetaceae bacterium]|nr:glycosyltransferase family 4 protein [Actinomycetaceae bacterium]